MSFETGRRRGKYWDDVKKLDELFHDYPFHTTGKNERDFENGIASTLMAMRKQFNGKVITQIDKTTTVKSIYCFGKRHRPDFTLDENGVAIEVKFITYSQLKEAIGQGHLYRLRYRFVILLLIVSEAKKDVYVNIAEGKEKDLENVLQHLADNMNIFTYIVPAFKISQPGMKKCISFFEPVNVVT